MEVALRLGQKKYVASETHRDEKVGAFSVVSTVCKRVVPVVPICLPNISCLFPDTQGFPNLSDSQKPLIFKSHVFQNLLHCQARPLGRGLRPVPSVWVKIMS